MKTRISVTALLLATTLFAACGGSSNSGTHPKLDLEDVREAFIECKAETEDIRSCKSYVARAINGHFQIADFNHPETKGDYVDYDEIAAIVDASGDWRKVGEADDQDALDEVQQHANNGKPALAISTQPGVGNVALIVKGEQVKSTSWGLNCPTAAIFFPNRPEKSFIGKTLNYAWSNPEGIELYVRD